MATSSAFDKNIFVANYSGNNGSYLWANDYGNTSDDIGYGVTVDNATGNIVVTGAFVGGINFGGGSQTSAGSFDIFLLGLTP